MYYFYLFIIIFIIIIFSISFWYKHYFYSCFRFIIFSLNSINFAPCNGLVKKSPHIISVGQYCKDISPFAILSAIKKYRILICFVLLLLDIGPFVSNNIALLLSCVIIDFVDS